MCIQNSKLILSALISVCVNALREESLKGQQGLLKYVQVGLQGGMKILLYFNENCECSYFYHKGLA